MPKAKDGLAQVRALRDDLRRLKEQYPELTTPGAQRRLAEYLETAMEKEHRMPAKGDRTMGEDLVNVTFKIPASAMDVVAQHLRTMQRTSRWQRVGRSDCLRDIFLRGIDSIENPPQQFPVVIDPGPELSRVMPAQVEPAAASAGGAIPVAPAYEARALTPEVPPELPLEEEPEDRPPARRVPSPLDDELEDMPLVPTAAAQIGGSVATAETVKTARPKAAAKRKTTRTTKGRK